MESFRCYYYYHYIIGLVTVIFVIHTAGVHGSHYKFEPRQVKMNIIEVENSMVYGGGTSYPFQSRKISKNYESDFDRIIHPLIVEGLDVDGSKFPYVISIQIMEYAYKRYHICSAVLVSTDKAITAAHCLHYWGHFDHYAAVGFTRLSQHGQALIKIIGVTIHPDYKTIQQGYPNDVAVITLEEHVQLSSRVQLANLSKSGDPSYINEFCSITGWGKTDDDDYKSYPDELQTAVLLTISKTECRRFFKVFHIQNLVRFHHTCAWSWPYSACYGDSGGPLVCDGDKVVGITSWAADCSGCFPVVFARVASFRKWIKSQIKK